MAENNQKTDDGKMSENNHKIRVDDAADKEFETRSNMSGKESKSDSKMTGNGFKILMLVIAAITGLYALGLFGCLIAACINYNFLAIHTNIGDPHSIPVEFAHILVFLGYLLPSIMSFIMYFDARKGKKSNWMMIVLLIGSIAFICSMSGDLFHHFGRGNIFGNSYGFWGSYSFNRYYIPIVYSPFMLWFMVRLRRRLSPVKLAAGVDSGSGRVTENVEITFYVINYIVALVLLIGALIMLVTGGGWGALAASLWGWMCFIPQTIALIIWIVIFIVGKGNYPKSNNQVQG